jgi:hypothetical protein
MLRSRKLQAADGVHARAYGLSTATDRNRLISPRYLGSESFGPTRTFPHHSCHGQPLLHICLVVDFGNHSSKKRSTHDATKMVSTISVPLTLDLYVRVV